MFVILMLVHRSSAILPNSDQRVNSGFTLSIQRLPNPSTKDFEFEQEAVNDSKMKTFDILDSRSCTNNYTKPRRGVSSQIHREGKHYHFFQLRLLGDTNERPSAYIKWLGRDIKRETPATL